MDILKSIAQGNTNIENIKGRLFDVKRLQLHSNLEGFNSPTAYGIYKGTGGDALGVVGKDFEPTQPKMLFDAFETCLYDTEAKMQRVEYKTLKDDKKILFSAPIKTVGFKNLAGVNDESEISLNLQTGFDGKTKTSLFLTMMRMICTNGMKAINTEFAVSFKNTKGNTGKVLSICDDVARAISQTDKLEEMLIHLNSFEVTQTKVDEFLKKVVGYNQKEYNELKTQKRNTLDAINSSIALEFGRTGSTLWGLVNGITHYTNHVANCKDRNDYLLADTGLRLNDKAQKFALEMAN